MQPPAVVFDLDGTLIDSAPDIHAVTNRMLAAEGQPPLSLETVRSFIGNGAGVLVARVMAARGLPEAEHARLTRAFVAEYEGAVGLTRLYPGVAACLAQMQQQGLRLGLCTNKPLAPTRAVLRHFGLDPVFAVVVGGDSLPVRKPDPAPLLHAIGALGGGPVLYVGDSEVDAECADRAGVPLALYLGGYRTTPPEALPHAVAFSAFSALPGLASMLFAAGSAGSGG